MAKKIIKYDVAIKSTKQTWQMDVPKVYTNDLNSVVFQFVVSDLTTEELSTATATTLIYMNDKSFFQNPSADVDKVGTTFSYTLKENEGNHDGIAQIQLVVTIPAVAPDLPTVYASQLYEFEVVSGLETKVAQEVMIYDWTTLTRDAQAYIDQFNLNETTRQTQFDDAQTARTVTFDQSETDRTTAFNTAEDGRTTAESGRVTAESGRTTAESNRVTAEINRVTAESGRVTAESGRVTAESARVTAETNRAAAFTAFDTRLTAEETATAANKISAVKSKTFADVDARFEDVEADTTLMGTNKVANGDFSSGTTGWAKAGANLSVANNTISITSDGTFTEPNIKQGSVIGTLSDKYYVRAKARVTNAICTSIRIGNYAAYITKNAPAQNTWYEISGIQTNLSNSEIYLVHKYADAASSNGMVMEVQYVSVINLTATFGAGNEPTTEQMDGIMAKFTNSWFDGTKNLFRANATLNKLMAVDARTEFEANNLVSGGNVERIDTALAIWGGYKYYINAVNGNKYYVALEIKSDTPNAVRLQWSNSAVIGVLAEVNTYKRLSGIITNDKPTGLTYVSATDTRSSGWTPTYTKNATVIDLTAAFGSGKEPTIAEMDRLMARFPNSWFDGVKSVQTIETLYQEKANKVQEAWITPTLVNGWIEIPGYPVRYMKDEMGFVHLKGAVKDGTSNGFVLPVGYRPSNDLRFAISSPSYTVTTAVVKGVTGTVQPNGYLDGITFRAEV